MYSPDHSSPPPVYDNFRPEIRQERSNALRESLDTFAARITKESDNNKRREQSTAPPAGPTISSSSPAIALKQADTLTRISVFLGNVDYSQQIPVNRSHGPSVSGQQSENSQNIIEASNTQLRAETLEILGQMREYLQRFGSDSQIEDRSQIVQILRGHESRLWVIAEKSPVLRSFIDQKRKSFLEPVQRNTSVRAQILKRRQSELKKRLSAHNIHGKQFAAAMEELRCIEAELGSGETDATTFRARHAHGLENLAVEKRCKTVIRRLTRETRKRLSPYTVYEVEQKKVLGKERDHLRGILRARVEAEIAREHNIDVARNNKTGWEQGFKLSPIDLMHEFDHEQEEDFVGSDDGGVVDDVDSKLKDLIDLYAEELKVGPNDYDAESQRRYDAESRAYEEWVKEHELDVQNEEREKLIQRLLEQPDTGRDVGKIIRRIERDPDNTDPHGIRRMLEDRRFGRKRVRYA